MGNMLICSSHQEISHQIHNLARWLHRTLTKVETHKVLIVGHKAGRVVVPGRLVVKHGDYVEFNALNEDVTIFIPNTGILADLVLEISATKSKARQVLEDAPVGEHPYAVFCGGEARNFAEGNSSPVIIIEPPPIGP